MKKFRNNSGFTMIELFVVIAIISILSSVVFLNWRHGEQLFALQNSAYKLSQDIREIQEMTMSAKVCCVANSFSELSKSGVTSFKLT